MKTRKILALVMAIALLAVSMSVVASAADGDYKLYIFPAACMMNDKKIALIKKKLQKNHATALWLYGSG